MDNSSGGGLISGELDGIAQDAHGLQAISDMQAQIMQNLANTMDGLASSLNSPAAGVALQAAGDRLHTNGMQFSAQFADHSQMMTNNGTTFDTADQDNAAIIGKIDAFLGH
jgi:hypothetical protein